MTKELNRIEINEIMDLLPHRYPFLLVDRVLDFEEHKYLKAVKNVSINEPFFTGHFPQQPVLPGVLILESLAQCTGILAFKSTSKPADNELYYFAGIDNARFKQPVGPGDVLQLEVELLRERRGIGKFSCIAKVDDNVVASADIMCARRAIQ
ncbi:3-hydroxyacyl-[acyl-carrier-protein] dehydratase FabZ [Alginatibacterium sediminis]|uniref:3-hydroxyacyl-[acyl-carrier-protein] dehydratase FabZ n=1 Tax=Alginatibacterium sediminis TaxID=2164068 RepID=A0A420E8T4_9ALTE|nr:3-hydroxyacyl-ACP dehydratase FabZ [Alginatibacterium sediminis]RKF15502.1 3-hydroxyacyl-[acyl-carrier-protein] dehydratase FabZ [Alginatibacterium sediminis]